MNQDVTTLYFSDDYDFMDDTKFKFNYMHKDKRKRGDGDGTKDGPVDTIIDHRCNIFHCEDDSIFYIADGTVIYANCILRIDVDHIFKEGDHIDMVHHNPRTGDFWIVNGSKRVKWNTRMFVKRIKIG